MANDQVAALALQLKNKAFNQQIDKSAQKVKGLEDVAKSAATVVAAMLATAKILRVGKNMLDAASDFAEAGSKFDVVFSNVAEGANAARKELQDFYIMSKTQATDALSSTADLLTGFGFTQEAALELSITTAKLGADLASFANFSGGAEGATKALTKALLGETESAKSLGIVIRQDTKEFKKEVEELQKATGATQQQAKAQVILNMAMRQSKNAIGDVSRTSGEYANQQRQLAANVEDLKVSIGLLIKTAIAPLIKGLVKVTNVIKENRTAAIAAAGIMGGALLVAVGALTIKMWGLAAASAAAAGPLALVWLAAAAASTAAIAIMARNMADLSDSADKASRKMQLFTDKTIESLERTRDLLSKGQDVESPWNLKGQIEQAKELDKAILIRTANIEEETKKLIDQGLALKELNKLRNESRARIGGTFSDETKAIEGAIALKRKDFLAEKLALETKLELLRMNLTEEEKLKALRVDIKTLAKKANNEDIESLRKLHDLKLKEFDLEKSIASGKERAREKEKRESASKIQELNREAKKIESIAKRREDFLNREAAKRRTTAFAAIEAGSFEARQAEATTVEDRSADIAKNTANTNKLLEKVNEAIRRLTGAVKDQDTYEAVVA